MAEPLTSEPLTSEPLTSEQRATVEANMGLVHKFCRRYRRDPRFEDLRSAAFVGLCYAVQKYDGSRAKLSTYAWRLIRNEVRDEMCRLGMIRLAFKHYVNNKKPLYLPETMAAAERVKAARKIEWSDAEAVAVLAVDHGDEFHDYTDLYKQLDALNSKDRHAVIEMVMRDRTQQSVGEDMGVSKERARQLKLRGLHLLRRRLSKLERKGAL